MSLIYGIIEKNGQILPTGMLDLMTKSLDMYVSDERFRVQRSNIALGKNLHFNTPESMFSRHPYDTSIEEDIIVFDGRIDNRKELVSLLNLPTKNLEKTPDEVFVLAAYRRWGSQCCDKLLGDFSFVIISGSKVFFARDHVGCRPLFISENAKYIAFSSHKKALLALPWVNKTLNHQWTADLLCLVKADKESTYYQGITSFLPAHYRVHDMIEGAQKNEPVCYWTLTAENYIVMSHDEYLERFNLLIEEAVNCRLRSAYPVASELSGGIDSTMVAGLASRLLSTSGRPPLVTCSHVLSSEMRGKVYPYTDENHLIADFHVKNQHTISEEITACGRGAISNLEENVVWHGSPSRADLTVYSDELFETLAQHQCRVLLSGFGGDQLVSSFAHGIYEDLSSNGAYTTLWRELAINMGVGRALPRWLMWFLRTRVPYLDHWLSDRVRRHQPLLYDWSELHRRLFIDADFARVHHFPQRHFDNPPWKNKGDVRERELYLFNRPALLYRIEDSAVGAERHGVEYRYPLLDRRLLEFCFSLPSTQKYRNGMNRRMMRMSGVELLPESILSRDMKTGATIPNAHYRRVRDKSSFISSLKSMQSTSNDVGCINYGKLLAFAEGLVPNPDRVHTEIPKAFDKSYQTLYARSHNI